MASSGETQNGYRIKRVASTVYKMTQAQQEDSDSLKGKPLINENEAVTGYEFWQQLNRQRANTGNVSDSYGDGCNSMRKNGGELVPKKIVSWQREMKVSAHPHASLVAKLQRKE